jgi:hypothetical protein
MAFEEDQLRKNINRLRSGNGILASESQCAVDLILNEESFVQQLEGRQQEYQEYQRILKTTTQFRDFQFKTLIHQLQRLEEDIGEEEACAVEKARVEMVGNINDLRGENNAFIDEIQKLQEELEKMQRTEAEENQYNLDFFQKCLEDEKFEFKRDKELIDTQMKEKKRQHALNLKKIRKDFEPEERDLLNLIDNEIEEIQKLQNLCEGKATKETPVAQSEKPFTTRSRTPNKSTPVSRKPIHHETNFYQTLDTFSEPEKNPGGGRRRLPGPSRAAITLDSEDDDSIYMIPFNC